MEDYEIKTYGDPVLRLKSQTVKKTEGDVAGLLDLMAEKMKEKKGVGLAAPQIGISKSMIIFDSGQGLVEVINPEITLAEGSECAGEGCLSVPGAEAEIKRAEKIVLKGVDRNFKPGKYALEGLPARIVQHELDHLAGILIIDHMSRIKRIFFERQWKKSSR